MFGRDGVPIKGHMSGVVGVLWRKLKQKEKLGELVAIPVDEYYTSQVKIKLWEYRLCVQISNSRCTPTIDLPGMLP